MAVRRRCRGDERGVAVPESREKNRSATGQADISPFRSNAKTQNDTCIAGSRFTALREGAGRPDGRMADRFSLRFWDNVFCCYIIFYIDKSISFLIQTPVAFRARSAASDLPTSRPRSPPLPP